MRRFIISVGVIVIVLIALAVLMPGVDIIPFLYRVF
jgi:hypothetical protein